MRFLTAILAGLCLVLVCKAPAKAEAIKIGVVRTLAVGPIFVADQRGYFKDEGLDATIVYFDAAQPIAIAAASGDIDFGIAGPSAGFYNLAAQGQVKMIGASGGDSKGFHALEFLASNKAWDAGLKTPHDLPGHTVAITQLGTALHNVIGILAERDHFPISKIEVKPLQSNSIVQSALIGGTVDAAVMPNGPIMNLVDQGKIKFLGWTSDYAPLHAGVMLLASKGIIDTKPDVVKRFLIAYRKACRDIFDAYAAGPDGTRKDGPTEPDITKIIAQFTGLPPDVVEKGAPFVQPDARIDVAAYANQIAWLRSEGLLKDKIDIDSLIDKRVALVTSAK